MPIACLNCAHVYEGNYCPGCGQKANTHRISFSTILHDIPHSIFHLDKGVLYTLTQLTYRPGKAVREYLAGKRIPHYLPFAYLFLLSGITAFITHQKFEHLESPQMLLAANPGMTYLPVGLFFCRYPALMFCTLIPVLSFISWIFNRDSQYNYWENIILNTYLIAQFNLFFAINDIIISIQYYSSFTPMLLCFFSYIGFAYYQFFRGPVSFSGILKKIAMFLSIVVVVLTSLSFSGMMTRWWWW